MRPTTPPGHSTISRLTSRLRAILLTGRSFWLKQDRGLETMVGLLTLTPTGRVTGFSRAVGLHLAVLARRVTLIPRGTRQKEMQRIFSHVRMVEQ